MHFNYHVLSDSISILIAISHRIVEFHARRKEEDWRKESVCERYDTIYSSKYNTRRTSLSAATVRKHVRTGWNDKAKGKNATRIKIERVAYRWRATVILRTFSIHKLIESFSKSRSTDRKSHNRFQNEKEEKESSTSFVRLNERVQNFSFYSKYFFFLS